jgi:hypothetical protein
MELINFKLTFFGIGIEFKLLFNSDISKPRFYASKGFDFIKNRKNPFFFYMNPYFYFKILGLTFLFRLHLNQD